MKLGGVGYGIYLKADSGKEKHPQNLIQVVSRQ